MLDLTTSQRDAIARWAVASYPAEACGLLLGRSDGDRTVVAEVRSVANLRADEREDRYELDPAGFVAADREARAAGLEVVGVWHSHPDSPAEPSETDRRAAWAGWSYVIAEVRGASEDAPRTRAVRSWRLAGEAFAEEPVELRADSPEAAPTRTDTPIEALAS